MVQGWQNKHLNVALKPYLLFSKLQSLRSFVNNHKHCIKKAKIVLERDYLKEEVNLAGINTQDSLTICKPEMQD